MNNVFLNFNQGNDNEEKPNNNEEDENINNDNDNNQNGRNDQQDDERQKIKKILLNVVLVNQKSFEPEVLDDQQNYANRSFKLDVNIVERNDPTTVGEALKREDADL